jgi:hypothetical protein
MDESLRKIAVTLGWVVLFAICIWAAWQLDARRQPAEGEIESLYRTQRSGVIVEAEGTVDRLFADDLRGSRHQRFVVRLRSGYTVLISHNIDLAPRIDDLRAGDRIAFRGEYEWNDRGGVVHWTHHDPDGRRPGGWLLHDGRTYR